LRTARGKRGQPPGMRPYDLRVLDAPDRFAGCVTPPEPLVAETLVYVDVGG